MISSARLMNMVSNVKTMAISGIMNITENMINSVNVIKNMISSVMMENMISILNMMEHGPVRNMAHIPNTANTMASSQNVNRLPT